MDEKPGLQPEVHTKPPHKPLYIAAVIAPCVTFVLMAFFNAMASGPGISLGIMTSVTGNISDKYYLEITPAGWTFSIWGVIYAWQVIFLGYGISTLFRLSPDGEGYLYYHPLYMHPAIYLVYCFNNACNITWIFLWDRELLVPAVVFIAIIYLSLYVCIYISIRGLLKYGELFVKAGQMWEIRFVRYFVQNGLGMYATWVTIATLLNLGSVITYWGGVPQNTSSTAMLSVLLVEALIYWILDNFVFDRWLRYMWTPYIVLHIALIGSLSGNWNIQKLNCQFTLGILCTGFTLTMIKIGLVIWRWKTKPIFSDSNSKVEPSQNTPL